MRKLDELGIRSSCVVCVHIDQPLYCVGNFSLGGCRERLSRNGPPNLRQIHCGQFYPTQLTDDDY